MKLAFQGSRSLKNKREEVLKIIETEIKKHNPEVVITSGEPDGVCRLAQYYCKRNGITLKLYHLNCKKYARGAFYNRSKAIIEDADYIVLIHDGKSRGTRNEFNLTRKYGKLYKYYKLDKPEDKKNTDSEIDKDWGWNEEEYKEMDLNI